MNIGYVLAFTLVAELLVAALLDAFLPDEQTDLSKFTGNLQIGAFVCDVGHILTLVCDTATGLGMMVGMLVIFGTFTSSNPPAAYGSLDAHKQLAREQQQHHQQG